MSTVPSRLRDNNPNYLISIFGIDEQGEILGTGNSPLLGILSPIPDQFSIETVSEWHPILEGILKAAAHNLVGEVALTAERVIQAFSGYTLATAATTQLLWESTSPVTFSIPLKFNAIYSAKEEVTEPIEKLLSLALPSDENTLLKAPGPTLNPNSKYHVHIAIGNMFLFEDIIVRSVNATFNTLSGKDGHFIMADVNLTISTSRILTKDALDKAFKNRAFWGPNNGEAYPASPGAA